MIKTLRNAPGVLVLAAGLAVSSAARASTEQEKQLAIDKGLAHLAGTQTVSGTEGYWPYSNDGTLAATASAALAFIEEGYLPGTDVVIDTGSGPVNYGDVVGFAVNYIFNRAIVDSRFGIETDGYWRYAEDYNNDGVAGNDGGNNRAIYFSPGNMSRNVYTTGLCAPVVYALGEALGKDTVIDRGSVVIVGMTYAEALQDVVDWFSWGQVDPQYGNYRGGWRYDADYATSDNSTAQWGALPYLYAADWGLSAPQYVADELDLWINYVQTPSGGSGYDSPTSYVNVSKTGGLLLELAVVGADLTDPRVLAALSFIDSRWNNGPSSTWYGNINHPYAMWAVYKALDVYGFLGLYGVGPGEDFKVGNGMPSAPGGFVIGQDWWDPAVTSLAGDWYSHYCDFLVNNQNADGSWAGYSYWTGALADGWYINILNAAGAPEPINEPPVALVQDVEVCADPGLCSDEVDAAQVDAGSFDPDGDPIVIEVAPPGPYPLGDTVVTLTVTDDKGESASAEAVVTVLDCEAPTGFCAPGTNPDGQPVPQTGGNPKAGQTPDGFYQLFGTDNCEEAGPVVLYVLDSGSSFVAGPFPVGQKVKITQSPGGEPTTKPMPGDIIHIRLNGDALLVAVDAAGNQSDPCACLVPPPPK